jgi:hypothetical protein
MKESKLNRDCIDHILKRAKETQWAPPVYYKIADKFTAGIPDSVLAWNEYTSWLEFKLLDPNESIHDQLDKIQLVELVKLQRTTGRAWVIAYRRANPKKLILPQTIIYSPRALWGGAVPTPKPRIVPTLREHLTQVGVVQQEGHAHSMVYNLIVETHLRVNL